MNTRIGLSIAVILGLSFVVSVGAQQSPSTKCSVNNAACNMAEDEAKVEGGMEHAMTQLDTALQSNDKKAIKEAMQKAKAELVTAQEKAHHAKKLAQLMSDHAARLEDARTKMRSEEKNFDGLFYNTDQFIIT